jgi:Protein of unknown function (DUF2804)
MPLLRGGRPRKRWTWVGAFGEELMLCAARAQVGALPVAWWAVWDRVTGTLVERSARGTGGVTVAPDRVRVRGRRVRLELSLDDGEPVEVVSPHGAQYAWTRKRGGVAARGWIEHAGRRRPLGLHAIVDESAGYHARRTAWRWSAGVGTAASGAAVAWNFTDGLHDLAEASERTVWVDGRPYAVESPLAFAPGLGGVGELRFTREAVRARREDLWLIASDYEQPFGTFAGTLPVAGALTAGFGVMERHEARW